MKRFGAVDELQPGERQDADLVSENVDVEDAPLGRVGHAVEIAADADHALVRSSPLEPQHRPVGRGRQGLQ